MLSRAAIDGGCAPARTQQTLAAALAAVARAAPAEGYAFVVIPDHVGAIPFGRNAQIGFMLPPIQNPPISQKLVVQTEENLAPWPDLFTRDIVGRLQREQFDLRPSAAVLPKVAPPYVIPDRWYCWSPRARALLPVDLALAPDFANWEPRVAARARRQRMPRMKRYVVLEMTPRVPLWAMLAGPAVAAFVLYWPMLGSGFLGDDFGMLHAFDGCDGFEGLVRCVAHTFVSGVGPPSNQYRPLTMASFASNAALGADPFAWHLASVLLQAMNGALVALLAWQLLGGGHLAHAHGRADGGMVVRLVRAGGGRHRMGRRAL